MGVLETRAGEKRKKKRKQIRMTRWQCGVLRAVGAVGLLGVAVCAPNAFKLAAPYLKKMTSVHRQAIARARDRLIRNGLLQRNSDSHTLELTLRGRTFLRKIERHRYEIPVQSPWDERWRLLIFDIREKRRDVRDQLRELLAALGFVRVQHSVWAHPYPCEDFVALLKTDWQLGKSLLYLVVEELEGDNALRTRFELDADAA